MPDKPQPLNAEKQNFTLTLTMRETNRKDQRRKLADTWLAEEEWSKYRYDVELCRDGKKVYLKRPTFLNKGFDFQICLEGLKGKPKQGEAPSHNDILNDLRLKKDEDPDKYKCLRVLIGRVHACEEPDIVLTGQDDLSFKSGLPVDALLKVIKWFFIEQDLTYWNGQGRRMLLQAITDEVDTP